MKTIKNVINQMPTPILLKVGRRICPEYGAVKEWDNRQYPQYFHNYGTLLETAG